MDIDTSLNERIGRIVFNRPEVFNAISFKMWKDIPVILADLKKQGAGVVVFSGSGDSFAAGADLCEFKNLRTYDEAAAHWQAIKEALDSIAEFELPTIAAVRGTCLGGGCLVALACELRYCEEDSVFGIPVAQLGIILDSGNIARLVSLVGRGIAAEMLYSGCTMRADRALTVGLVNGCVKQGDLEHKVQATAKTLLTSAANSLKATKQAIVKISSLAEGTALSKCEADAAETDVVNSYLSEEFRSRIRKIMP
jgi:enoyl-CoA hydratase/carnithine racemase